MNTKRFLLLFLIPVAIFAMEETKKMTTLKKWEDVAPFAGKIVAFPNSWQARTISNAVEAEKSKNIVYGFIWDRLCLIARPDTAYPRSEELILAYKLIPLMKDRNSWQVYISEWHLTKEPLEICLVSIEELEEIRKLVRLGKASFRCSNDYLDNMDILDKNLEFAKSRSNHNSLTKS